MPPADLLPERLDALLAVIYLSFSAVYTATGGDTLTRGDLCAEGIRLARPPPSSLSERKTDLHIKPVQ